MTQAAVPIGGTAAAGNSFQHHCGSRVKQSGNATVENGPALPRRAGRVGAWIVFESDFDLMVVLGMPNHLANHSSTNAGKDGVRGHRRDLREAKRVGHTVDADKHPEWSPCDDLPCDTAPDGQSCDDGRPGLPESIRIARASVCPGIVAHEAMMPSQRGSWNIHDDSVPDYDSQVAAERPRISPASAHVIDLRLMQLSGAAGRMTA